MAHFAFYQFCQKRKGANIQTSWILCYTNGGFIPSDPLAITGEIKDKAEMNTVLFKSFFLSELKTFQAYLGRTMMHLLQYSFSILNCIVKGCGLSSFQNVHKILTNLLI